MAYRSLIVLTLLTISIVIPINKCYMIYDIFIVLLTFQAIKEEEEKSHCTSSEFGDDERSEPDGQSTPSFSNSRRGSHTQNPQESPPGGDNVVNQQKSNQSDGTDIPPNTQPEREPSAKQKTTRKSSAGSEKVSSGRVGSASNRGTTLLNLVHSRETSARQRSKNGNQPQSTANDGGLVSTRRDNPDGGQSIPVDTDSKPSLVDGTYTNTECKEPSTQDPISNSSPKSRTNLVDQKTDSIPDGAPQTTSILHETNNAEHKLRHLSAHGPSIEIARPPSNLSTRQDDPDVTVDGCSSQTVPSTDSKSEKPKTTTRPPSATRESVDRPMSGASERRYTSLENSPSTQSVNSLN